jgi:hypothetical protein
MTLLAFRVRAARPIDVPALTRFKRLLAESEDGLHTVRATAADWLRDAFGAQAGFAASSPRPDTSAASSAWRPTASASSPAGAGRSFFCKIFSSKPPIAATA